MPPEPAQMHVTVKFNRAARKRNETADSSLEGSGETIYLAACAGEVFGLCTGPDISWLHLKSSGSATVAQKDKLLAFCSWPYLKYESGKLAKLEITCKHFDNVNGGGCLL